MIDKELKKKKKGKEEKKKTVVTTKNDSHVHIDIEKEETTAHPEDVCTHHK